MKKTVFALALLCAGSLAHAQTKIGHNPTPTPAHSSAWLELSNDPAGPHKGFLPPKVTTAQRNAIASPAIGLTVYNTTTECLEVYTGATWKNLCNSNINATFNGGTLACGALAGTYTIGVAMSNANTKAVSISVTSPGDYTVSTNTVNGVSFAGTGTFGSTGTHTAVLTASGTPAAGGTFSYTASLGGQTCTFSVTFTPAAVFACGNTTQTISPNNGTLTNNTSYTGTYTIPYTSGNGGSYAAASITSNGLTLTRAAGTYAPGGGNVVYDLSGTYTGTTSATVTFATAEGCNAMYGADAVMQLGNATVLNDIMSPFPTILEFWMDNSVANAINDGNSDAYDGGNAYHTNLSTNPTQSNGLTYTRVFTQEALLGPGGEYRAFPSNIATGLSGELQQMPGMGSKLFMFEGKTVSNLTHFEVLGNMGSDGSTQTPDYTNTFVRNGWRVMVHANRATADPDVNEVFIVKASQAPSATLSVTQFGGIQDNVQSRITNIGGATRIFQFTFLRAEGSTYTQSEYETFVDKLAQHGVIY